MLTAPEFDSYADMESSEWLQITKTMMAEDIWPAECIRCSTTEEKLNSSLRLNELKKDPILRLCDPNYLIVSGVLDNICNSACHTCSENHSTKIGSLPGKNLIKINNVSVYDSLPHQRILQLDVNGGEPSASPNYKKLLGNLPPNLKMIRLNTNGALYLEQVEDILKRGIQVVVTMSLDGIGPVHDYVRWPVKWSNYSKQVERYKLLRKYKNFSMNFWTTVSALNVNNLPEILSYSQEVNIPIEFGILHTPEVYSIFNKNAFTEQAKIKLKLIDDDRLTDIIQLLATEKSNDFDLNAYIEQQDIARGISIKEYL
jgi:sulfatase maturation enzyme AslB (radical SAM superfamily)